MASPIKIPIAMVAYQVVVENGFNTSVPGFTIPGSKKKNRALQIK